MLPQDLVPKEIKPQRKFAWENKRCATHHPGDGFSFFPEKVECENKDEFKQELREI